MMQTEMTIDDAINVANVASSCLSSHEDEDVRELVIAAKELVNNVEELYRELERERARRHGTGGATSFADGHPLELGTDGGGRRDFLASRGVHAGETLYLLTYSGWHPVRYEPNMPRNAPLLYVPLRVFERRL
jgi:prepilin-type processing-associated H-X9-DG protein